MTVHNDVHDNDHDIKLEVAGDRGGPGKFKAYVDSEDPNKGKLIRDVWKKGDYCFRSGDYLSMDEHGWLYFQDRTGDTFRWRGENVSTLEVEAAITKVINMSFYPLPSISLRCLVTLLL